MHINFLLLTSDVNNFKNFMNNSNSIYKNDYDPLLDVYNINIADKYNHIWVQGQHNNKRYYILNKINYIIYFVDTTEELINLMRKYENMKIKCIELVFCDNKFDIDIGINVFKKSEFFNIFN